MGELTEWVFFLLIFPGMLFSAALGLLLSLGGPEGDGHGPVAEGPAARPSRSGTC